MTMRFDAALTELECLSRVKLELEQTFDAVSDLIFIVDNDHTIVRANAAMAVHFDCSPKDLIGHKCFEFMHSANAAPAMCPHARMLESRKPQTTVFNDNDHHRIFEVTISPMFNTEGQITGSVHVARDVTEKKCHEEQLAEHQKQLESVNASLESRIEMAVAESRKKDDLIIQQSRLTAMGEMISTIAHQWRQPLNNIGLIVQSLQLAFRANDLTQQEMDEEIAETMKILQQVSDTIDDFRNYFSSEEEAVSFNINEIINRSLTFIEPSLRRKGISLELNEEPGVSAEGYPNEYMQAFLNIMLNAKDALLAFQVAQPQIRIRIFHDNGRSIVTVSDNGGGIREDALPKIYEPYFTTKNQNTGAGIGLYMAKAIIEKKMCGSLSARNVDNGAEFRIEV